MGHGSLNGLPVSGRERADDPNSPLYPPAHPLCLTSSDPARFGFAIYLLGQVSALYQLLLQQVFPLSPIFPLSKFFQHLLAQSASPKPCLACTGPYWQARSCPMSHLPRPSPHVLHAAVHSSQHCCSSGQIAVKCP